MTTPIESLPPFRHADRRALTSRINSTLRVVTAVVAGILMCVGILPAAANATPRQDEIFDAAIHKLGYNITSAETFHTAGPAICKAVDAGVESWDTVVGMLTERGFDNDKATAISAATILAYCPWTAPRDTGPRVPDRQSAGTGPIV